MQINDSTINPYQQAQKLVKDVEAENGNSQIDSNQELESAKKQLNNFKIPGTNPTSKDADVLIGLNNKTGETSVNTAWQNSGASTNIGQAMNIGSSNQSRLKSFGATDGQINSEHNSFVEFNDGSIGFKSTMLEGDTRYGIFKPDTQGNIDMAKGKPIEPNADQKNLLDKTHSIRQELIENSGGYGMYKQVETVQDQIADLKAASIIKDGNVESLLSTKQLEYVTGLEKELNELQSNKSENNIETLAENLHEFDHLIIDNSKISSYLKKTDIDDGNKNLKLDISHDSGSANYLRDKVTEKSKETVAEKQSLSATDKKEFDVLKEKATELLGNKDESKLTASEKYLKSLIKDDSNNQQFTLQELQHLLGQDPKKLPPIPSDPNVNDKSGYADLGRNFLRPYFEAFGKDNVKNLEDGGKLKSLVNTGGTKFSELSFYRVKNDYYYDYDDEGIAGKAGEDTREYQMLKEDSQNPDKYTEALPIERIIQDDLKYNIMVHEQGDQTRIFEQNKEIKPNKDGNYLLNSTEGKLQNFSYKNGLFKKLTK
jgi:hypothetical protein